MKKMICLLAACLLIAAMSVNVFADNTVQSMIDGLPTVEEFQTMDSDAQLEAYNKTQAAYDAYMALSEAEQAEISGGEAVFETLFAHFNALIMPLDAAAEQEIPAAPAGENDRTETLLAGVATLAVVIVVLRILNKKKQ